MVDLTAKSAFSGMDLPLVEGPLTLSEFQPEAMFSVAPFRGQHKAVEAVTGPLEIGRATDAGLWVGRNQWFVIGPCPALSGLAALTDQSDGWAWLELSGQGWRDVLARLAPIDAQGLDAGAALRTELAHMAGIIVVRDSGVRLAVMRSFAGALAHEVGAAMRSVVAQRGL